MMVDLNKLAASGVSSAIIVPVTEGTSRVKITLGANYAAQAGTTGMSAAISVSLDGGSTYIAGANTKSPLIVGAPLGTAGVFQYGSVSVYTGDGSQYMVTTGGQVTKIKIVVTNLDGTNVGYYAVDAAQYDGEVTGTPIGPLGQ